MKSLENIFPDKKPIRPICRKFTKTYENSNFVQSGYMVKGTPMSLNWMITVCNGKLKSGNCEGTIGTKVLVASVIPKSNVSYIKIID